MRRVLFLVLVALCVHSAMAVMVVPGTGRVYDGIDEDSMRVKLSQIDLQPLEGIWYYPAEDMTVAIERMPSEGRQYPPYHIVLLSSTDINVLPGTEIGYIETGAVTNEFTLHLFTESDDNGNLHHPVACYATMNGNASSITFERPKIKVKVRVNFARFLPSIFKGVSVIPEKDEKKVHQGFRKVFPEGNGNQFNKIRYL